MIGCRSLSSFSDHDNMTNDGLVAPEVSVTLIFLSLSFCASHPQFQQAHHDIPSHGPPSFPRRFGICNLLPLPRQTDTHGNIACTEIRKAVLAPLPRPGHDCHHDGSHDMVVAGFLNSPQQGNNPCQPKNRPTGDDSEVKSSRNHANAKRYGWPYQYGTPPLLTV